MLYFKDDFFAGFVREEKMMEFLTELEERQNGTGFRQISWRYFR